MPGILKHFESEVSAADHIDEINTIPDKALISKMIPWLMPAIVIGLFVVGFLLLIFVNVRRAINEAGNEAPVVV